MPISSRVKIRSGFTAVVSTKAEMLERRVLMTTVVNTLANFGFEAEGAAGHIYQDSSGTLFGLAPNGTFDGNDQGGSIFEYPVGGPATAIAGFPDGFAPTAGIISNGDGNFYGMLSGNGLQVWKYVLGAPNVTIYGRYDSSTANPGITPSGTLYEDSDGDLFGTTQAGGASNDGTVWELQAGSTTITDLADFTGDNGSAPKGGIVEDSAGNLFGTTSTSTTFEGEVWELPATTHTIKQMALVGDAEAGLVTDGQGNYFGTTTDRGGGSGGDIFEWNASDGTTAKTLAVLDGANGSAPRTELLRDSSGDLFGTASVGGNGGFGSVFELVNGASVVRPLSFFSTDPSPSNASLNGVTTPDSPVVLDASGDLLGLASAGGGVGSNDVLTGGLYQISAATIAATVPKLVFTVQPNLFNPYDITPAVTAKIEDASGNVISSDNSAVSIGFGPSDSGILQGTTTVNAVDGVAVFSNLNIESGDLESPPSGTFTFQLTDDIDQSSLSDSETIGQQSGGGGGGGGTTTGTSSLSPTVIKTTLPTSVVAGASTHGKATVAITNNGSGTEDQGVTVNVYADASGVDTQVGTLVIKKLKLAAGATTNKLVSILSLPASLNGTYSLLAATTDSSGTVESTSGPALQVAAAFVAYTDLSIATTLPVSAVSGGKTTAKATIVINNTGNIASTGMTTIALYASTDGSVANGTLIRSLSMSLPIKPGAKPKKITVPLVAIPSVVDGSYSIVAQLTDPTGNVTTVVTPGAVALAAPFLSLVPTLSTPVAGAHGMVNVSLTVINNGNTAPVGKSQIILLASLSGGLSDATMVTSEQINLPIKPGKTKTLPLHLDAATVQRIQAIGLLVIEVIDPMGGSQIASVMLPI